MLERRLKIRWGERVELLEVKVEFFGKFEVSLTIFSMMFEGTSLQL
jgi:hypothetical protein